jgi:hypothetical protein
MKNLSLGGYVASMRETINASAIHVREPQAEMDIAGRKC